MTRLLPAVALLGACATGPQELTLDFAARIDGADAACGTVYDLGASATPMVLQDLRLFVHDVRLVAADGTEVPFEVDDGPWSHDGVHLLDFEDATAGCAESGTAATHTSLTATVPGGAYTGVRLALGVPFEHNHLDPAGAPPPLDTAGMFWAWKSGYKYARIDLSTEAGAAPWLVHLGAGGCSAAAPTAAPAGPCDKPNVAELAVDDLTPGEDTLAFDVAALVAGADLSRNTDGSPPGCMSAPEDGAECTPIFEALGMDFATGRCVGDCAAQDVLGPG